MAVVAFGLGAAGLATGLVTGLMGTSTHGTLQGECNPANKCPPSAQGDIDSFQTLRTVSTVAYVVGAVGVAGGAVLWLTARAPRRDKASACIWLTFQSAGFGGRF